ncbi:hypothetical protein HanRHA438_Chr05g0231681 [Helianthus annuus]|uniref:Uncharacterized protein n=1 Tax=Helianthus annuus TaxID=4232 RepID=A0A9K3J0X8_HELAN|nr:hypothetical protein HanXRQr2_Chr05g0222591 [Helianthus annuus]KAJ0570794.1 hypothetical protein HanHA300_Chr05g0182161 [Helianthus annuus]KAJ0577749.1 hypothetical protein HanIR_Chr05g0239551 [Helianthus annuus]KAJ0585134.1 hypothetical protein HanHA89_Chr05g0196831 [Helianthus annuus]KAJ0919616.1 hypothetical protein HanRHA438_Chr05g0231681 [Helianthus annuus]
MVKKTKKTPSSSADNVLIDLTKHLSGGKSSREEAARARSAPSTTFSGSYLPVDEAEVMETGEAGVTSKDEGKVMGGGKVVSFSGTILGSSLGPDCFLEDDEDQVSFLPSSWFGPEVITFFWYEDVFSDEMEVDPATTEEKFIPDLDIKNKDSVMDALTAKMFLFSINTLVDHSRSRRMKSQDLGMAVLANQTNQMCMWLSYTGGGWKRNRLGRTWRRKFFL